MKKRLDRRDRTWRYSKSSQKTHLDFIHPSGDVDCVCERSVLYFAKQKSLGCRCRKRKTGQPKIGTGCKYDYSKSKKNPHFLRRSWKKQLKKFHQHDVLEDVV